MASKKTVRLGGLSIGDWLESYRLSAAPATHAEGPLNPNTHEIVVRDVVPGPYPDWHYQALAMLRLLEAANKQRDQIEALESEVKELRGAVGALVACIVRAKLGTPNADDGEALGLYAGGVGISGIPDNAKDILARFSAEADLANGVSQPAKGGAHPEQLIGRRHVTPR